MHPAPPPARRRPAAARPLALLLTLLLASAAGGQEPAARPDAVPPAAPGATLRGVVFDSLAWRPLAGARVWTADGAHATESDSLGRWVLEGVPGAPGATVAVLAAHPAADSVGLSTLAAAARLGPDGTADVVVAIPSYGRLYAAACAGIADAGSAEGGVLVGTVRDAAGGEPLAGATVRLSWLSVAEAARGRRRTITDVQQVTLDATADGNGGYYVCGIPITDELTVRATAVRPASDGGAPDTLSSGELVITIGARRILRRDFLLGGTAPATVIAQVLAADGRALEGARVIVDAGAVATTGRGGSATMRDVLAGTRVVRARALGFLPGEAVVDVAAGDTARAVVRLAVAPPQLDAVVVRGSLRLAELDARRVAGYSYVISGDSLATRPTTESLFWYIPRVQAERGTVTMPGRLEPRCAPLVLVNGARASLAELYLYRPDELLAVEVFMRGQDAPRRYVPLGSLDCGVVLAWTK